MPDGYAYPAWTTNVIHKNAPGAMRAIAFTVTPVRPNVGTIFGASCSAIVPPRAVVQFSGELPTRDSWSARLAQEKCHQNATKGVRFAGLRHFKMHMT